jgi:AraC-like DNA-binding protein
VHLSRFSKATTATQRFVRGYVQREAQLGASSFIHPVQARSAHLLDFEFGDAIEILPSSADITRRAEAAALVGIQTCQLGQLLLRGSVETFVIFFHPAAIHQLFGLSALETTNRDYPAHAVLGPAASELQERLGNAASFEERVQVADRFIASRSFKAPVADSVERAANEIVRSHGGCRMDALAHDTGLSIRSFQRMFRQRIGVSPKLYARIVRFESALKTKAALHHMSWTTIAHEFGYHDQMHMIHDFRGLSGETPTGILERVKPVVAPQLESAPRQDPDLLLL